MFLLIFSTWFIRQIKTALFWIYLWQLKEYHLGRFFDHFRTYKGKKLFLNWLFFSKIILFLYALIIYFYFEALPWYFYAGWIIILFIFYFFESIKFLIDIFRKKEKKPIFTSKAIFLILVNLILIASFALFLFIRADNFIYWFSFGLLFFDIFSPFLISGIVLLFEPITILLRNRIIKKAKEKRAQFKNLLVVGITGSYGKTSTKEFLATILEEKFSGKILKTKEHQNSEIGISQCILNELKPEHEFFIVEMGAYRKGGIKFLCDIVKPHHGILTGVNEQHLALFGSMENLISAEGGEELIESLPGLGFVVFNGDNEYCRELYKKTQISKRICYTKFLALEQEVVAGDYWVENIKTTRDSLFFKVFSRWGEIVQFEVNLPGEHWAQNILMAAIIAKDVFGMTLEEIAQACKNIKAEHAGGMRLIKGFNNTDIIESTYSINPDGVISHLDYLKSFNNKKIIVMPCLIELGKISKEIHYKIGQKIGETCHLAIITTKDRFDYIQEGAFQSGMPTSNVLFIENPKRIFWKIKNFSKEGDVILLEGRVPKELINLLKA